MDSLEQKVLEYEGDNKVILEEKKKLKKGKGMSIVKKGIIEKQFKREKERKKKKQKKHINDKANNINPPKVKIEPNKEIDWNKYKNKYPYDYQKEGIKSLIKSQYFLLGDDMGVGKTTQSIIAAIETNPNRVVIVCPAHLDYNWLEELLDYLNEKDISRITSTSSKIKKWNIVKYSMLPKVFDNIMKYKYDILIADEAHFVKNPKSKRSQFFKGLCKACGRRWFLTGTPLFGKPIDMWNILNLLNFPEAQNYIYFGKKYCNGYQNEFGWDFSGYSNLEELKNNLSEYMLRRLQHEVKDLPKKTVKKITYKLNNKKEYNRQLEKYIEECKNNPDKNPENAIDMVELSLLLKYCAIEKSKNITPDLIDNSLEYNKKVVVFTKYTEVVETLLEKYKDKAVRIDGKISGKKKQENKDSFQNDPNTKIVVCNIIAAGTGYTLTAGNVMVMNDFDWIPENHLQAEARVLRIGQENNVLIYYPIYKNTIENHLYNILRRKSVVTQTVMDGDVKELFPKEEEDISKELHKEVLEESG